jgi:hypothetical protein
VSHAEPQARSLKYETSPRLERPKFKTLSRPERYRRPISRCSSSSASVRDFHLESRVHVGFQAKGLDRFGVWGAMTMGAPAGGRSVCGGPPKPIAAVGSCPRHARRGTLDYAVGLGLRRLCRRFGLGAVVCRSVLVWLACFRCLGDDSRECGALLSQGGAALALGWNTAAPLGRLDLGSTGRWRVGFGGPPKPITQCCALPGVFWIGSKRWGRACPGFMPLRHRWVFRGVSWLAQGRYV